ncbi:hypothetical protein A2U01_0072307, partial [Trifolium medium]|nr:hypothetical protein [Trifolium medium]
MLSRLENALSELLDPLNKLGSSGQPPNRVGLALNRGHRRFQLPELLIKTLPFLGMG